MFEYKYTPPFEDAMQSRKHMGSLQYWSCSMHTSIPHLHISRLPTNASRSHHFQVSCSSGSAGRGIDRRNMLLGLGGLYGATNFLSDTKSEAAPIAPPDLKSCDTHGAVDPSTGKTIDVNCCPLSSDVVRDYDRPAFTKLRLRPAAHLVDKDYVAKYNEAYRCMKELDAVDPTDPRGFTQQANIHCAYCNGPHDQVGFPGVDLQIHNSWTFFPFHRWYLHFHERILGSLIGDDIFALPFWNWDNPPGMKMPDMFDTPGTHLYDLKRNQGHRRPAVVNLAGTDVINDPQDMIDNNLGFMYNEMISVSSAATDFMGQPMRAGDKPKGPGASERGSHVAVHKWVGNPDQPFREDMGNFYSAGRDPMFYSHHANVDRMWSLWKNLRSDYSKDIFESDFLDSSFLFYDENKALVRVKVVDCLDHRAMGYEYQHVPTPWVDHRPTKRTDSRPRMRMTRPLTQSFFQRAKRGEEQFPLTLNTTARVLVAKTEKGKADEVLVIEDIVSNPTEYVKFDVYINDEEDEPHEMIKAEYAGTYAQLPHREKGNAATNTIRLSLRELYENIGIEDDESVVVTVVPRSNGEAVTIGGIKIIKATR